MAIAASGSGSAVAAGILTFAAGVEAGMLVSNTVEYFAGDSLGGLVYDYIHRHEGKTGGGTQSLQ